MSLFGDLFGGLRTIFSRPAPAPYVPVLQGKYPAVSNRADPTKAMTNPQPPTVYVEGKAFFSPHNSCYYGLDFDGANQEWIADTTGVPQAIDAIYFGFLGQYDANGPIAELFGPKIANAIAVKYGISHSANENSEFATHGAMATFFSPEHGASGYYDYSRRFRTLGTGPASRMFGATGVWNGDIYLPIPDAPFDQFVKVHSYQLSYAQPVPAPVAPVGPPASPYGSPYQTFLATGFNETDEQIAYWRVQAAKNNNGDTSGFDRWLAARNASQLAWANGPGKDTPQAALIHAKLGQ